MRESVTDRRTWLVSVMRYSDRRVRGFGADVHRLGKNPENVNPPLTSKKIRPMKVIHPVNVSVAIL